MRALDCRRLNAATMANDRHNHPMFSLHAETNPYVRHAMNRDDTAVPLHQARSGLLKPIGTAFAPYPDRVN